MTVNCIDYLRRQRISKRSLCAINDWLDANREAYKKYKEEIK